MSSKADSSANATLGAGTYIINPKPIVEGLTEKFEVDLDALGSEDLRATIQGAELKVGDVVLSNWRGLSPDGVPFDKVQDGTVVEDAANVTIKIANKTVVDAGGGYAFLSYQVNDSAAPESLRQFCYIGLRPPEPDPDPEQLPVVQVLQSHGLEISKPDIKVNIQVVTAAYQAIQEGDKVELTVRRFRSTGTELSKLTKPLPAGQTFKGEPLEWLIPLSDLNTVDVGGRLEISYTITLKDGGERVPSRAQTFMIRGAIDDGTLLAPPSVDNGGSDEIEPGNHPNGLSIRIDGYPQRAVGDYMALAWVLPSGEKDLQIIRLDESSLLSARFTLRIAQDVLLASVGAVQVFYQYGREGRSQTSRPLSLKVVKPRAVPPMPTVRNAKQAGAVDEYNIDANDIRRNGASVIIPGEADVRPSERLEVHWQGEPNSGRTVIESPSTEGPRVFNVPAEFVAANMGNTESKRFEVFYRLVDNNTGDYWDSKPVKLLVLPLPVTVYPRIDCPEANSSEELVLVPAGATLKLESWVLIKEDQRLSFYLSGIGHEGGPIKETVRNALPVTSAEVKNGASGVLEYAVLRKLKVGAKFQLWASVSFDGDQWWDFPKLDLTLKS
ncbi:hypothetical protein ACIP02_22700 [Pseudomonas sp. NPDC089408]|uniref:hypothetical protein n=1 Tax=Pseudomonas sp. NPDC089408 TaxID=3364465 RepID=UPI00381F3D6C